MIDLHMHTIYSDGSKTVEEILKMCEDRKLECISITDHNNCEAYYDEAFKKNNIFNGIIIKGCELNVEFQNKSIELLGYNIDTDFIMEWREKYYSKEKLIQNNNDIENRFLKILNKKCIKYNKNDIRQLRDEKEFVERTIWEEIVKHPANREIIGKDNFESLGVFYRKELTNPNSDYFLNRVATIPKVKEVVDIIHEAGGMAFLAHPFEYKFEDTIKFIEDLRKEVNLDGLECFHPSAKEEQMKLLVDYVRENKLYMCGGSDYHGYLKKDVELGIGKGNLNIAKETIKEWYKGDIK